MPDKEDFEIEYDNRYSLEEVMEILDLTRSTIEKYEEENILILPTDEYGNKYFTDTELNILREIKEVSSKRYTIAEVSKMLDISISTIRKYETDYNLTIPRDEINHRYYTETEIKVLRQIKHLKDRGYNIHQIKKVLGFSVDAKIQQVSSQDLITLDKLTGQELKELISKYLAEIILEKEEEIIERAMERFQEQRKAENKELIEYLEKIREEQTEMKQQKKGFFRRLFGK